MDLGIKSSLEELIAEIHVLEETRKAEGEITGICLDSREIKPGNLFVASTGTMFNGHAFIDQAVEKGAAAVVGSQPAGGLSHLTVPYFQVEDPRKSAAQLSAAYHGYPGRKMVVVGVTGTDGKTT
ncbi:MAG: hypothetical protein KGY39_08905, partial [Anaerolineales bacterium]|nr:hypothetical protein [Anaerolineales bacterium]